MNKRVVVLKQPFRMEDLERRYRDLLQERKNRGEQKGLIKGTCQTFCPEFEGLERTLRNDISQYEADVMVKKYHRSSAGRGKEFSEDLRPLNVLFDVTNYLLNLCTNNLSVELYQFVENRTRAIRMDIAVQELDGDVVICILENIARFHILFGYYLFDNPLFEAHLNLDQLKKIFSTLASFYTKRKRVKNDLWNIFDTDIVRRSPFNIKASVFDIINSNKGKNVVYTNSEEEFFSYFLLVNPNDKYPCQIPAHLNNIKIKMTCEIIKKYQQRNFVSFFNLCKKLDFLAFCLIHVSFDVARFSALQMYLKAFVERIDLSFFYKSLWMNEIETQSLFRKKGISIVEEKANFKDNSDRESDEVLIKARKIAINMEYPSLFLWYGCLDYNVYITMIYEFTRLILMKYQNGLELSFGFDLTNEKIEDRGISRDIVLDEIPEDYISKLNVKSVCTSVFDEFCRKITIDFFSRAILKSVLTNIFNTIRRNYKEKLGTCDLSIKHSLCIVTDKKIFSALFKNKVSNSILSKLAPMFFNYDEITFNELIKYNLCVFALNKTFHSEIKEKYFMLNCIVDTPQNLNLQINDIYDTCISSKKVIQGRLLDILNGKTLNQKTDIIARLIENGKNNKILSSYIVKLHEGKNLVDCDIYFSSEDIFT